MVDTARRQHSVGIADKTIITALIQARIAASALERGPGGREMALAITKLQEALFWCNQAAIELEIAGHQVDQMIARQKEGQQ